ncbi:MAG: alpha/beta hydrolase [Desulfosudaceae bacterium]
MKKFLVVIVCVLGLSVIAFSVSSDARKMALDVAMMAEAKLASMQKKSIVIDDHNIVYLERSATDPDAETLILLHGFSAEKNNWPRFSRHLEKDLRIIAIDWPAHGESSYLQDGDYRLETQADRLYAMMDKLGIPEAHLVGNSMGGAIAAIFASRFSEKVITLTLMNSGGADNPRTESDMEVAVNKGENPLLVRDPSDFGKILQISMEKPPFIPWPVSTAMAEMAASRYERFAAVFEQLHDGVTNTDTEYLKKIDVPTLIMWGNQDRILDVGNMEIFKSAIPNNEVIVYQDVGHLPMLEVPKKSATDVRRFIEKHS